MSESPPAEVGSEGRNVQQLLASWADATYWYVWLEKVMKVCRLASTKNFVSVAILNLICISTGTGSQWRWARRESAGRWRYGEFERTIRESVFCVFSSLKFHLIFLSYGPGLTSMQHTTSHTTAAQSPPHFQWYILIGKQRYQLPEFIPSNSNSVLHSCISISIHTQHVT